MKNSVGRAQIQLKFRDSMTNEYEKIRFNKNKMMDKSLK